MSVLNYTLKRVYINKYTYFRLISGLLLKFILSTISIHQIQLIVTKYYQSIRNTDAFVALHFGTQLKHKISNIPVLMDLVVVYYEIINYKWDL